MGGADDEASDSYTLHLGPHPEAARCARIVLERNLADWGLAELLDDASLVTGELVSNAARQGAEFTLDLIPRDTELVIEVTDHSPDWPEVKETYGDDDAEDGRGLFIVAAIADSWGARPAGDGKTVWAVISK